MEAWNGTLNTQCMWDICFTTTTSATAYSATTHKLQPPPHNTHTHTHTHNTHTRAGCVQRPLTFVAASSLSAVSPAVTSIAPTFSRFTSTPRAYASIRADRARLRRIWAAIIVRSLARV